MKVTSLDVDPCFGEPEHRSLDLWRPLLFVNVSCPMNTWMGGQYFEDEGAIPFAVPALHKRDELAYSYPEDESFLFEFVHYGEGVLCVVFDVCDLCAVVF